MVEKKHKLERKGRIIQKEMTTRATPPNKCGKPGRILRSRRY